MFVRIVLMERMNSGMVIISGDLCMWFIMLVEVCGLLWNVMKVRCYE